MHYERHTKKKLKLLFYLQNHVIHNDKKLTGNPSGYLMDCVFRNENIGESWVCHIFTDLF